MKKRAQAVFGLSFGAIFSIILIIAIVAVAIYVTTYFLGLSACSKVGFFYDDLQSEIDDAWTSGIYRGTFPAESESFPLPSKIETLCLGNLTQATAPGFSEIRDDLEDNYFRSGSANIFLHPTNVACDGELFHNTLEHVKIDSFNCVEITNGTKIRIESSETEPLVILSLENE